MEGKIKHRNKGITMRKWEGEQEHKKKYFLKAEINRTQRDNRSGIEQRHMKIH